MSIDATANGPGAREGESRPLFTVLTPTYRGRELLRDVARCLAEQSVRSFEWIIVIDGEDSETESVARALQGQADYDIRYFTVPHNHKKAAVNFGVARANGEFVVIADDDDLFPADAFQNFLSAWESIDPSNRPRYAGVTGLCVDDSGQVVGDRFPEDRFHSDLIHCSFRLGIRGEKWSMYRRDVMLDFPFFEDALGYVGESTVWLPIARQYKTLFINEVVRHYRFNPDSIINAPDTENKLRANVQAYTYGYKHPCEHFLSEILRNPRLFAACTVNYVRFFLHSWRFGLAKSWMTPLSSAAALFSFVIGLPAGIALFVRDRLRFNSAQ